MTDLERIDTVRQPVTTTYHGVEVTDDYRWLENWDDPAVKAWSDAQNAYARSVLDHLPGVDTIRKEVTAVRKIEVPRYTHLAYAGGTLFALKFAPPKQQAALVALSSADDPASARVIVDPNAIDARGTTAIDWYVPSPDGSLVAVSVSRGGSEQGDLHVYETATGKDFGDLEDFKVLKDGREIENQDFNFWGVTFTGEDSKFYATLGTGSHHYLVEGDAQSKTAKVVRDGIECPSLSPDGTRLGYKARVGKPFQWRFHVLDLKTGKDVELTHEGSIDDQIAWIDDDTLAYGNGEETFSVPADGSAPPKVMLKSAVNPSRVR
jgi:protease II